MNHHSLTTSQLQAVCQDDALRTLAPQMNSWRNVDLGLEKGVLEAIDHEPLDEEGKRRKLLERWKEMLGHEATYERLIGCLLVSKRTDLADVVCEAACKTVPRPCAGDAW